MKQAQIPFRNSIPQPERISQNQSAAVLLWVTVSVSQLRALTERPTDCNLSRRTSCGTPMKGGSYDY